MGVRQYVRQLRALAVVLVIATGCDALVHAGATAGGTVADAIACPTGLVDCGHVYMCEASAGNALGHVEVCVDDDGDGDELGRAEDLYGPCEPTPRHQGLCLMQCDPGDGRGCNAFNGCLCPEAL